MLEKTLFILDVEELSSARVIMRADGIMHVDFREEMDVSVDDIMTVSGAVKRLGEGKRFPHMITMGQYTSITPEAREYMITEESNRYTSAAAFVTTSIHQRLLVMYFLRFNKSSRPMQLFSHETGAADWLKSIL
jgi:hypothetical protein